jgi:hypothetical protein
MPTDGRGAVETAAADGNRKRKLSQHFLDDFHKLLGKAVAKTAPAFPQLPQRPAPAVNKKR